MTNEASIVWGENGTLLILVDPSGLKSDGEDVQLAWESGILLIKQGEQVKVRADFSAKPEIGDFREVLETAKEVVVVEVMDETFTAYPKVTWEK